MDLSLAQWILQGGSTAVLLIGIWALMTGRIRTVQEVQAIQKDKDDAITRLDMRIKDIQSDCAEQVRNMLTEHAAELAALRLEHAEAIKVLEQDRTYFRDLAMAALQKADRSAEVAQRALQHAEGTGR